MSRYVWLAAVALVALSAAVLFWIDKGDEPALPRPPSARRDAGGEWAPHPDRAGLPRRRRTE